MNWASSRDRQGHRRADPHQIDSGKGDHESGRRHQRGVTPCVAKRSNPSTRARLALRRSMRSLAATTPARIYAVNCSRKVTMRWSLPRCSKRCAPKNCWMTGATPRISWPIMLPGDRGHEILGVAPVIQQFFGCRALTLTDSGKYDSWVTGGSRALSYARP